jgi:hypothetical protein
VSNRHKIAELMDSCEKSQRSAESCGLSSGTTVSFHAQGKLTWPMICQSWHERTKLSRLIQTSKFSMTSFYVTSFICKVHVWVYVTNFIWQVFIWQVLFTGVNVSEKGDRKIIIVRLPITSNPQITLTIFLCWPIRRTKFVLWQFFLWQVHLFKS